jgi:hypothetical protein
VVVVVADGSCDLFDHPTWPQVVLGLGLFALIGFVAWLFVKWAR